MRVSKLFKTKLNNNHIVNDLKIDSRLVEENDIFFAIKGTNFNGNQFILSAIKRGAKTICSEYDWDSAKDYPQVNFIITDDVRKSLAQSARIFYNNLTESLNLIGVTGTNGKTTVTTLVYKYFQFLHKKATLIGTNGIYIMNTAYSTINTTPDILEIYKIIRESKKQGINTIIMEVSSHAVKMLRIYGLEFKLVLLTNLTQDHLDFHKTFDDYKYSKGLLLNNVNEKYSVVINKDIDDFKFFNALTKCQTFTYGQRKSHYQISNCLLTIDNSEFDLKINEKVDHIKTKMLGIFNIYNITSFVSIIHLLGLYCDKTLEFLNSKINILGRMEILKTEDKHVVIDFAHTPDGVLKVLQFLNMVKKNRVYCVIGCGGDRDQTKRPIIGDIVTKNCDFAIFTNDNPRGEDPNQIVEDMITGVENTNFMVILDRRMAIEQVLKMTLKNDIIAILGKGNEQYQIIGNEKLPFSDKKVVQELSNESLS